MYHTTTAIAGNMKRAHAHTHTHLSTYGGGRWCVVATDEMETPLLLLSPH